MNQQQIVIADDSQIIREAMKGIIAGDYVVIASVEDGSAAVEAVQQLNPDMLLLDISMPSLNGFDAALQIQIVRPLTKIIFVSEHREQSYVRRAFAVGASGYVVKSRMATELIPAMREVSQGREYGQLAK